MHPSSEPVHTHCRNCGESLKGPYCHSCGQRDFEEHQPFWHLVHEVLESFFHFEGKFFRGTLDLLFKPGHLTNEFNAGRRASQMPPLRLYIFISLLFFIAPEAPSPNRSSIPIPASSSKVVKSGSPDTATNYHVKLDTGTWLDQAVQEKLPRMDQIVEHFAADLPKMLLVCMPLFALLSLLLFRNAGMSYLQHLVFALHLHSFFLLFELVTDGWGSLLRLFSPSLATVLDMLCWIYAPLYAYLALRSVFGQQHRKTLLRGTVLLSLYAMILLIGVTVTFFAALLRA